MSRRLYNTLRFFGSILILFTSTTRSHQIFSLPSRASNSGLLDSNQVSTGAQSRRQHPISITGGGNAGFPMNSPSQVKSSSRSRLATFRRTVFPIYGREVTKFLLIGSIKFFVILALTLTRDTKGNGPKESDGHRHLFRFLTSEVLFSHSLTSSKDTLVVTQCGAEAIAFLKIYGVLPSAALFIALYSKLSNVLDKRTLFYVTCVPFFAFFATFDLLIYPNASRLHPSAETVQRLFGGSSANSGSFSGGLAVLAKIFANWTSGLFYIVSEIYSSVSVGLLFWQFANDVVSVDQAKRFYPLFAQMSGLAPVVAGQFVVHYASQAPSFGASLHRLTAAVSFAGLMICLFFKLSVTYVEKSEGGIEPSTRPGRGNAVPRKSKMSMLESAKFLASSEYLRLVASLVLGYGLSINLTEIIWKSLVKKQYPNPLDYQKFMGNFSSAVGLTTCIVIFFGVHAIRLLGWRFGALATPCTMAALAVPFFACILLGLDSPSRLQVAVWLGTMQSLLSKAAKYALFDPTTQMAYIPLDDESKVKGKAAIDVLGSRIGKSGASLFQQGLVFACGSILNAAPVVGVVYYAVLLTWIAAASRLSSLFQSKTDADETSVSDTTKKYA